MTSPSIGPDAPLRDEQALERLFRANFSALVEESKSQLKDAASSAGRAVEATFIAAWADRERFKTPQELDAFLHEEIKHASARILGKRVSAQRFAHGGHATAHAEAKIDVNESWQHVLKTLHPNHDGVAEATAEHSRHDTAAHVAGLGKKRSLKVPIAIGVVAGIIALAGVMWLNHLGRKSGILSAINSPSARSHPTLAGQFANVQLDDGTTVKLAPGSNLIVPENFSDGFRYVKVAGAAAFIMTPGHNSPLEIYANNAVIDATGTQLDVRNFPSDSSVTVFVKDGQATVTVGKDVQQLPAGQSIRVLPTGQTAVPTPAQLAETTTWPDNTFTVSDRKLGDVLHLLKQWYSLDIFVQDTTLLDRNVSFAASLASPDSAIKAVEQAANLKFSYEGQTMVFKDAAKAPVVKNAAARKKK